MATKRFITPFAETGVKVPVSDIPAGTDVNYETGYTPEYALDPVTDPSARFVEITNENQILNDITGNIKLWQDDNYPEFVTTASNGGVAHSYNKNVVVRYDGDLYISTEDANDTLPTSAKWIPYLPSEIAKYLELKIFQSPTDGLTEITTRTLQGGEVYEVRNISDDSLATIYSDAAGTTEIVQDGTSSVSGDDGVVEFYIADGDYYLAVGVSSSSFGVFSSLPHNVPTVSYLKSAKLGFKQGDAVSTKGYYEKGDGGGSTGVIKTAAQASADGDVITGLIGEYINVELDDGNFYIMLDQPSLKNTGSKLDGVDDNDSFMAACEYSRAKGIPIRERTGGVLRYTDEADFTANGAGLIWAGVTKGKLLYAGAVGSKAVKVDQGGAHQVYSLSAKSGVFVFGEVVQGNTTGNRAVVRSLFDTSELELQTARGTIANEIITGLTSGATATVTTSTSVVYGSSLQDIKLKGFTIAYDRSQSFDGFSRPLDWAECVGLYLNAFRNSCEAKDIRPEGFRYGHVGKANYLGSFTDIKTHTCWAGHTMFLECNNILFDKNSVNRAGSIDNKGWSLYYTTAYSSMNKAFDAENSSGLGIIYENLRGCSHNVGDIESNSNGTWQIKVQGLPGIDYADPEKFGWIRGFTINGARFREDLGIEFRDGVTGVGVTGCHWDATVAKGDTFIARLQSGATHVENIYFDNTNSYYGDNDTYQPSIPLFARTDEWLNSQRLKYSCLLSQSLDITNANGYPVGNLPVGATVTQIDVMADNSNPPSSAGSFQLDLGVDASIASIINNDVITIPTGGSSDVLNSPYGLYKSVTAGLGVIASGGVLRARIDTNTAGSGRVFIRVWYKSEF